MVFAVTEIKAKLGFN